MKATIIIPTIRRPDSLSQALASVARLYDHSQIEQVIVVDNDPHGSAKDQIEAFASGASFPVHWVHEPRAGVANARNTGVAAAANAQFIAFLDDDETASPQWLDALLATQTQTSADAVFGPIAGQAPTAPEELRPFIEDFFSRHGPETSGLIQRSYGCGNSLLKRSTALIGDTPFCATTNETGGEDDVLFSELMARGGTFAWAADAWVDEHAPERRANLDYILKRAFAYGQGPTQSAAKQGQWLAVLRWMIIGAGQMVVFAIAALFSNVLARPSFAPHLKRSYEGAGKLFWFSGLEPKFYGQHELNPPSRRR